MKTFLATHHQCFQAEWMKLKRTGITWLCLGVALFIPLINTLVKFFIEANDTGSNNDRNSWDSFIQSCFDGFTGFFFPLFMVITMVRIVYLEHRSDTWKILQTQPVSREALFLVKFEVALIISLCSLVALLLFAIGGAYYLQLTLPGAGFKTTSIHWTMHLAAISRFWIATWGFLAFQYFISLVFKSFAWPMMIGLVAIIAGAFFNGFNIFNWFPYSALSYTRMAYGSTQTGGYLLPHEWLSILWAVLFLVLGYRYFIKRDLVNAFFRPAQSVYLLGALILVFSILFWWINKPVVLDKYDKTVIAGTIQANKPVDKIILASARAYDTLMVADVRNGEFHAVIHQEMTPGIYYIKAGNAAFRVFMGNQDSIFLDITSQENNSSISYGGTRVAENEFLEKNESDFNFLSYYAYNYTPRQYANEILRVWANGKKNITNFKTAGNIRPAADFISIQKKLLALKLLRLVNIEYPKTHAIYHPNEKLVYPPSLQTLFKEVDFNNDSLAIYPEYIQYITDYIGTKTSESLVRDTGAIEFIMDSIPSATIRNEVLVTLVDNKLDFMRDSVMRTQMLSTVLPLIKNAQYRELLKVKAEKMNSLMKGKIAPGFTADALSGDQLSLSQFANRYVIIDVWATWCAPCKREEPYFDELAYRYTSPGIAFISLSIDEDRMAWQMEASSKSKRVVQLWAKDGANMLSEKYAVNSIPRFMLIDPKGKIINARMPPPSDPEFEAILEKEIHPSFKNAF